MIGYSAATRVLARKTFTPSRFGVRAFASLDAYEDFGKNVFTGQVADQYLQKHGLSGDILDDPTWVKKHADAVANAVFDWAIDNGANVYCHWFQPMASSGVRHGQSGQVQNIMLEFDKKMNVAQDFKGKTLIKGETDGSSYPNGGLRGTHQAGGYLAIDTSSPIALRGDTIFIPSVFVSYYGASLDEKTPLLRANNALNKEGSRLLEKLGLDVSSGIRTNIGLEQEIFLVPRDAYYNRPDLQLTGRTVIGKNAPRGQEMCDHYMAPLSSATPALSCMQEIQDECWRMGIPLKTRHREVAPNQFEFAPLFGTNTTQIDQNLWVMQIIEEVAPKHGLAALLQEKPFNDINGSGKHNNWSIATNSGVNILNPGQLLDATGNDIAFPVVMAALVAAIDEHGDLMRMAISSPGNDFRLGACEAPPAIISTYLGDDMTNYLDQFRKGESAKYEPGVKTIDLGCAEVLPFEVPAEDRNRTSPFPYGGARFEFRAVGSSQNVSMVNTVLNTIAAEKFGEFADRMEAGEDIAEVAREALNKHWKVIFNGDNYCEENQAMLTESGVWRIDSGVEAISRLTAEKNVALFEKMGVLNAEECAARQDVIHDHYTGTVEMEALTLVDMINQHIIPAVKTAGVGSIEDLESAVSTLKAAIADIHAADSSEAKAEIARVLRLEAMVAIRAQCDATEEVVPENLWPLATYKDLLFLDSHTATDSSEPFFEE
mmetsp:Transcript_25447/g.38591  ORF Transcript_25447/g.38591 Transcript_25447/m.38591 type:complete len:714 (-) Transcript_25447:2635-4776(-)|eukprot:CAMPEP_0178899926 /NCGR_PEP_ID=MMETSP0786-20121207/3182_1 /TAXON_ID=186022 /ORGANISM="Thalassionema frauenfeldii, Strain CCMP 1798" /LENGTH=713 /DNA_ID=CAMNT_0020570859 /DNA_START=67 /DNA_END=2208 /DNA_ORIENTATION=-